MGPTGDIVLVVDDDPDVRESLELVLRDAGYDVFLAEDGQVALDMLGFGLRPAVILLDLMMPRVNGFEFLERFRKSVAAAPPVVVLSANRGYDAKDLGVANVLRKPANLDVIIAAIENAA